MLEEANEDRFSLVGAEAWLSDVLRETSGCSAKAKEEAHKAISRLRGVCELLGTPVLREHRDRAKK
jgi:hypothetical protein